MSDLTPAEPSIRRLAILGVGLIGGSLSLAAASAHSGLEVRGYDVDEASCAFAEDAGIVNQMCDSATEAVEGADVAAVCVPVRAIPGLVAECMRAQDPPRAITDVGSAKESVITKLPQQALARFVGGHPICGAESAGVSFARADLFRNATYFLAPSPDTSLEARGLVEELVGMIGATPVIIKADVHDRIMALMSHAPHVLANIMMQRAGRLAVGGRRALFSSGPSFKDLTRIAGSNPPMWRDIFMENRKAIVKSLRGIAEDLESFCEMLENAEEDRLLEHVIHASSFREELLEHEDIAASTLCKITVRIPDEPGVLSRVMGSLGERYLNIEDLTLHHHSRRTGGDLVLWMNGSENALAAKDILVELGYSTVVALPDDSG